MSSYLLLKTLHIISSVVLVGTGFGSAFYLYCANRSRRLEAQVVVVRYVVLADWIFTTPAGVAQLVTGFALLSLAGWSVLTPWVLWSLVLYVLAGACWLPVLWLQIRMRAMAEQALAGNGELPPRYWQYARWWECLGYPAFLAMLGVYFLMVLKPALAWSVPQSLR